MPSRPLSIESLALLCAVAAGQEPVPAPDATAAVRAQLAAGETGRLTFRVHEACDQLLANDAAVRQRGGDYLLALMIALARDTKEPHEAEEHRDFFERQRRARDLHLDLGRRLGDLPLGGGGAEAAPALLWLWRHGDDGEERAVAAFGLTAVHTPEVDHCFQSIVDEGCTVGWALCYALEQAARRSLPVDAAALTRLCQHYQAGVRERARRLAAARGLTVPEYAPEQAFGAELEHTLAFAVGLTEEPVPAHAPWVELTVPAQPGQGEAATWRGWLLQHGAGGAPWRLLTNFGRVLELDLPGITTKASSLADCAEHLIAQRQRYAAAKNGDERRRIEAEQGIARFMSSSSDTWQGSATELLVAAWSFARGDRTTAARLLQPPLSGAWDAADYLRPLLYELAAQLDVAMLEAFAGARDYGKAIAIAGRIVAPELEGFRHQDRARELLAQLPQRSEDFRALQLPRAEQWAASKKELPRARQIEHLVQRLRLLCCQQFSIPGRLEYDQEQFGAAPDPRTGLRSDPRINPFVELLHLDLTADELPALLPALESRDYILAYEPERFPPQRPETLHRVAFVAAMICNEVAQQGIVDARRFLGDEAERERARAEFVAFCHKHAGQHATDRLAARMTEVDDWQEVRRAFWNLNQLDPVRAAATMRELGRRRPELMSEIVRLLALLDRGEFVGEAREWLAAAETRFFAAVLLLRHRQETDAAFEVVRSRLLEPDAAELVPGAVDALAQCGLPAAKALLLELLAGEHASGYRPSAAFLQRLVRAGYREAMVALDEALAGKRRLATPAGGHITDAVARLLLVAEACQWWPDVPASALRWDEPGSAEPIAAQLRERLAVDWQHIVDGTAPGMRDANLELPWGDLLSFSSGWIRRF